MDVVILEHLRASPSRASARIKMSLSLLCNIFHSNGSWEDGEHITAFFIPSLLLFLFGSQGLRASEATKEFKLLPFLYMGLSLTLY